MKNTRLCLRLAGLTTILSVILLPGAALADTAETEMFDKGWQLRAYLSGIDFSHSSQGLNRPGGPRGYNLETGGGVGVNAEYRFSRRLGLDLGVLAGAGVDIEVATAGVGSTGLVTYDTVTFMPVTAGLDIHLTPDHRVDVYFCPMAALVYYSGLDIRVGGGTTTTAVNLDQDFALGAALGFGVPFGDRPWSFQANVMYLDTEINGTGPFGEILSSTYDATTLGFGFGYRF